MIEAYIDEASMKNAVTATVKEIERRDKMFKNAILAARSAAIEPIKKDLDDIFNTHAGRHPDREQGRPSRHFKVLKYPNYNVGFGKGDAYYGITVEAADDVGIILMQGSQPHDIAPRNSRRRLNFIFTDSGNRFIGPPGKSLDDITGKTDTHPGHVSYTEEMVEIVRENYYYRVAGIRSFGGVGGSEQYFDFVDIEDGDD